jgi:hypothetical protein
MKIASAPRTPTIARIRIRGLTVSVTRLLSAAREPGFTLKPRVFALSQPRRPTESAQDGASLGCVVAAGVAVAGVGLVSPSAVAWRAGACRRHDVDAVLIAEAHEVIPGGRRRTASCRFRVGTFRRGPW